MRRVKFNIGKLKQWSYYKKNNIIIWLAGLNNENSVNEIWSIIDNQILLILGFVRK